MKKILTITMTGLVLMACQSQPSSDTTLQETATLSEELQAVNTSTPSEVKSEGFTTLGKVVATRYADLSFQSSLPIMQMYVKNGQQVRQGQRVAELDMFRLSNTIEQQKKQIAQSELQMKDVIIAQGYDPDVPTSIPAEVKQTAEIKSGYQLAKEQLAAAEHELKTAVLNAPFDGTVANVKAQAHEIAKVGEPVCRIISSKDMAVEFRIMEADLAKYRIGTTIIAIPTAYKDRQYEAIVSEVNPIVDQQGAITVRARLPEAHDLFDGMNVEIMLK